MHSTRRRRRRRKKKQQMLIAPLPSSFLGCNPKSWKRPSFITMFAISLLQRCWQCVCMCDWLVHIHYTFFFLVFVLDQEGKGEGGRVEFLFKFCRVSLRTNKRPVTSRVWIHSRVPFVGVVAFLTRSLFVSAQRPRPHLPFILVYKCVSLSAAVVVVDRPLLMSFNVFVYRAEVSDDGPLISGARERYELNEQLDVNCTAPRIRPDTVAAAHRLTWQLNNQTVWNNNYTVRLVPVAHYNPIKFN